MNMLADESVDGQIVEHLRQLGHNVWYVAEMEPGVPDDVVLQLANQEQAILLTADKDFGELVFRQQYLTSGVLLIRLAGLDSFRKAEIVATAIQAYGSDLPQAFAVITAGAIRIRRP